MHILEGKSLLNDASGLICMRFAVAAALTGTFSLVDAFGRSCGSRLAASHLDRRYLDCNGGEELGIASISAKKPARRF